MVEGQSGVYREKNLASLRWDPKRIRLIRYNYIGESDMLEHPNTVHAFLGSTHTFHHLKTETFYFKVLIGFLKNRGILLDLWICSKCCANVNGMIQIPLSAHNTTSTHQPNHVIDTTNI